MLKTAIYYHVFVTFLVHGVKRYFPESFDEKIHTLCAPARILAKGSDFGRSGLHFEQRVQTLDAPA